MRRNSASNGSFTATNDAPPPFTPSGRLSATVLHLLRPPQHLRERYVGKGAEERVRFELAAGQARRGETGQEAGEGSRAGQGLGQVRGLLAQAYCLAQAGLVEVDGRCREKLRGLAAVLAPGAVAAGMGEDLAEVRREEGGLATVVGGEGQHLVEAGDLAALALEGPLVEGLRDLLQAGGRAEPAVGVAQ